MSILEVRIPYGCFVTNVSVPLDQLDPSTKRVRVKVKVGVTIRVRVRTRVRVEVRVRLRHRREGTHELRTRAWRKLLQGTKFRQVTQQEGDWDYRACWIGTLVGLCPG